ncbi:MAG: hypothetical protein KGL39_35885 [Patescibacteria group bacterium]|nr:hypothetical protein [Patescibacteria group bacterium]
MKVNGTQVSVRITNESLTIIDELVKLYNRNVAANASRQSVIRDLIARGIQSLPRKKAPQNANTSDASPQYANNIRTNGEE